MQLDSQNTRNIVIIFSVTMYWPTFALVLKRLHDFGLGRAWFWLFVCFVCVYVIGDGLELVDLGRQWSKLPTLISLAFQIVVGCIKGEAGPNRYGPDPLELATAIRSASGIRARR
jgi:uncharacterized membrane protein YhaH (DUF805 family)